MTKMKILLVDDDKDYRSSLHSLLEIEGFAIEDADSSNSAQQRLSMSHFDIVLADLHLVGNEDMQGLEVARIALELEVPCIIITAFPSIESVRLALRSHGINPLAFDYVLKQQGPHTLLNAIHRLCGMSLLHISDLHPRITDVGEAPFDQEKAYSDFLTDVTEQSGLGSNPLQAIIVSGDISFQAKAESFEIAGHYLDRLSRQLAIPKNQVVLSPGNHDINRDKARMVYDTVHSMRAGNDMWFKKFDEYLDFTRHFYGRPAFSQDKLYRMFRLEGRVAVVSFNSCLLEGDPKWKCQVCLDRKGKEHYHGIIERHQVQQAAEELDKLNWRGLRIGVFHHHVAPEDWQPISNACQGDHLWSYHHKDQRLKFTFFEAGFCILLYGHRHKVELKQSPSVGSNVPYHFGSGAFWTRSEDAGETANYLLLQLSPIAAKSRVIMRRYYPATSDRPGYWGADHSIQPNGTVPLTGLAIPEIESPTSPIA